VNPPASITDAGENLGDRHSAATRNLFNKLIGQLHHCLQTGQTFDEAKAFQHFKEPTAA
jgi:hypothetical protein